VPRIQENDEIDISAARWVLVIEKEVWMRLIDQLFAHEVQILTEALGRIPSTRAKRLPHQGRCWPRHSHNREFESSYSR
jgi:hypothetical protein